LFAGTIVVGTALFASVYYFLSYKFHVAPLTKYLMTLYPPILRYSEFLAGCLAGLYFVRWRADGESAGLAVLSAEWGRNVLIGLCLLFIAGQVWAPEYSGPSAELWLFGVSSKYTIFVLPFSILILAIACGRTCLSWILEHPAMVLLGEASYALYMIHWPFTTVIRMGYLGTWSTPLVHGVCLLATVGLSILCYRFIEVPCRLRLRGLAEESPRQG
jgi:peptidoglycan/LPS O-acetylase OafA/YrhL